VKLAQTTGLKGNKGGSNGLGDGEVGRVNLVELATVAANLLGFVVKRAVDVGALALVVDVGVGHIDDVAVADSGVLDVRRGSDDVVEDRLIHAEVLGQDVLGGVSDPVVNVECGSYWS